MGTPTSYRGTLYKIAGSGGYVKVTGTAQANSGTSLPCCGVYIVSRVGNTGPVYWNIDIAASSSVGQELTEALQPFFVPIDDVSKLYFYSATGTDIVDLVWIK